MASVQTAPTVQPGVGGPVPQGQDQNIKEALQVHDHGILPLKEDMLTDV
jgi:hypothetical protein